MMGFALFDTHVPVTKSSSAVTAFLKDPVSDVVAGACINCGRCVESCPSRLLPSKLADIAEHYDEDRFVEYNGLECVECGCCSYICPAKRHLTQEIKMMRQTVLANRRKKK